MLSHFLIKEPIQYGHPVNTPRFVWPIGDQVNIPQSFFASQPHRDTFYADYTM